METWLNARMTIKCIAFDLDNTLWDCDSLIINAEHEFYQWLSQTYPQLTQHYTAEALLENRVQFMRARPEQHHNLTALRKAWLRHLVAEHHLVNSQTAADAFIEEAFTVFWLARNKVEFYDGALAMLENLAQHYSLGVITNGNASVTHIGIGHLFAFSLSAAEHGASKPDVGIFQHALKLAGVSAAQMVYVGDDPYYDVDGAQQAGIPAIWYNPQGARWAGDTPPPAAEFRRHHELQDIIANL